MAALTMNPTIRQPLASLDSTRMRSLLRSKMNLQNQQNAMALKTPSEDAENIDPSIFKSTKRKRALDDDEPTKEFTKPVKSSRMALTTIESKLNTLGPSTPVKPRPSTTPKTAPFVKPAGRSPQSKSCKAFGRRSTITKSRPEPVNRRSVHRPFSIATALASEKKPLNQSQPKKASWFFEIHVDSEQDEMTNLMHHSTGVLDISDDEGKASDARGKENIPPAELGFDLPSSRQQVSSSAAAAAVTRKAMEVEDARAPLGELNAADYYGADCHAFSYAIVYDDESETPQDKNSKATVAQPTHKPDIQTVLEATAPADLEESKPSDAEVKIWESGTSAS